MVKFNFFGVAVLSLLPSAFSFSPNHARPEDDMDPRLTKYTLSSPDGKIKASWMPFGAALLEFFVEDKDDVERDLVMGFDNRTTYTILRGQLGSVLGRYAGRLRNGTFSGEYSSLFSPLSSVLSTIRAHICSPSDVQHDQLHDHDSRRPSRDCVQRPLERCKRPCGPPWWTDW